MTKLHEFFRDVYQPLKLTGRSEKNKRQYEIQFRHLSRYLGREATLGDLTDETISRFLAWLYDGGRAAPTVNKARAHLLALWRLAAQKRYVAEFPAVRALDEPERIPQAWTIDQLRRLLAACRATPGEFCGVPASLWWLAFHRVMWVTGERTGATLGLRWDWLDMTTGWLLVPADARKGRRKAMAYQLPEETLAVLRLIEKPRRALIFPFPLSLGTFYIRYGKLLKRAGLPQRRIDKPQKMRRSFASHYEAAGGNATDALGHSFRRTTTESYLDPTICRKDRPADKLPPLDDRPPPIDAP